jgi:hypothetical protein
MKTATQPDPSIDEAIRIGDLFYHHAKVGSGVVKIASPGKDWNALTRDDLTLADADPSDLEEASRWCVLFENLPECERETAIILYLDKETGDPMMQAIDGPMHDHDVAIRIVARDLAAVPKGESVDPSAVPLRSVIPPAGGGSTTARWNPDGRSHLIEERKPKPPLRAAPHSH